MGKLAGKNSEAKGSSKKLRSINSGKIKNGINKSKSIVKRPKLLPSIRKSDQKPTRKSEWTNRERVLVVASRGVSYIARHVIKDLLCMLPHGKTDSKLDNKRDLSVLNELAEMSHTNKILYFENRKKRDLYLWLSCAPNGPSAKFLVENVRTTSELKLTGNCLKASRPILAFDKAFEDPEKPHLHLLHELFVQVFGTPNHHPRSQPYIDKVFSFGYMNNRIWFRTYQIAEESAALAEVGPRFSLNLIGIFAGSFSGAVLYSNPHYISPNWIRHSMSQQNKDKYAARTQLKVASMQRKKNRTQINHVDELDEIFA